MNQREVQRWLNHHVADEMTPAYELLQFFARHAVKIEVGTPDPSNWIMIHLDSETTINWNDRAGFEFPEEALYALWKLMGEQGVEG